MPENEIRRLLGELETTIEQLGSDTGAGEHLTQLSVAVQAHLDANENLETAGLVAQLNDAIEALEAEHPTATAVPNNILTTLSSIGI